MLVVDLVNTEEDAFLVLAQVGEAFEIDGHRHLEISSRDLWQLHVLAGIELPLSHGFNLVLEGRRCWALTVSVACVPRSS